MRIWDKLKLEILSTGNKMTYSSLIFSNLKLIKFRLDFNDHYREQLENIRIAKIAQKKEESKKLQASLGNL